jgi:DNA invertase Pin-like site-specific DNA recombinase
MVGIMRIAGYMRVSTAGQIGEGHYGLDVQEETIRTYAEQNGHDLVYLFSDQGVSGAKLDRPGLQDLLDHADEFTAVVVAKTDRVARDLMAQLWIEKELLKRDVELISIAEPVRGRDPSNVLFRQILGAFAEFERNMITDRLSSGRRKKAKGGGYAGGNVPLGYRRVRQSKKMAVDPSKTATVRRCFELRDEGRTMADIASQLNTEGHTTARDKQFTPMQVKRILDNRDVYRGNYRYGGIESKGEHRPILAT